VSAAAVGATVAAKRDAATRRLTMIFMVHLKRRDVARDMMGIAPAANQQNT
jgi:hypothetical protein